ncbi:MAG: hypothetical protein IGQ88_13185 [Gloeomargaritaceae cyanobacterium C42_A2020_066]|nr:hypothetical protein [Gloeomargaritaceae cyanobacterium C42_A2020_066]
MGVTQGRDNAVIIGQAAAVAGHANLAMVSKTYGHLVTGIQLPRYG